MGAVFLVMNEEGIPFLQVRFKEQVDKFSEGAKALSYYNNIFINCIFKIAGNF